MPDTLPNAAITDDPQPARDDPPTPPPGVHDVFMLGWEFPPFISGGLGTACYGLTKAMSRRGDRVLFVLPGGGRTRPGFTAAHAANNGGSQQQPAAPVHMPEFENVDFQSVDVKLSDPYERPQGGQQTWRQTFGHRRRPADLPEVRDLPAEANKYADKATDLAAVHVAAGRRFDVVHAHDWMTFPAAQAVAESLGIPFVAHVHSTEHDRAGPDADEGILAVEAAGLAAATRVVAVSEFTAGILASHYGVSREKMIVIHNALEPDNRLAPDRPVRIGAGERVVLFLGRITPQKGPEYFVKAARKVLEHEPNVRFVMAGSGEQATAIRQLVRGLGIEGHFLFTGFLRGGDVDAIYAAADVFVMPSVSEPFGIVSLEAMRREVPTIISKQSGAAGALEHALKVDFWDTDELASLIVSVLRDPTLAGELGERGSFEVRQMTWGDAAESVARVYDDVAA